MNMLKTKLLASAAALVMTAGTAVADSNESKIEQSGAGNDAAIAQPGQNNTAGTDALPMLQLGTDNDLEIVQSGDNNQIGTSPSQSDSDYGLYQSSNRTGSASNQAEIRQTSDNNIVGNVDQIARGTPSSLRSNTLTVIQEDGNGNSISSIYQSRRSSSGNSATVVQSGEGNSINSVSQVVDLPAGGNKLNTLSITISGDNNAIDEASQTGRSNQLSVAISGNDNGQTPLSGVAAVAASSSLVQDGQANAIDLEISGSRNAFGVNQTGNDNKVGTIAIAGDDNNVGVSQMGNDNEVAVGTIEGSSNLVGVMQQNDANYAQIDIVGGDSDGNTVSIEQQGKFVQSGTATVHIEGFWNGGDDNVVVILQQAGGEADIGINGDRNDIRVRQFNTEIAEIDIDGDGEGDNNFLDVLQANGRGASPNQMFVDIYGDDNNRGSFTSGSDAAMAASGYSSGGLGGNGLQPGEIEQREGNGNLINLTVGDMSSNMEANANLFAMAQKGSGNAITGSIMGTGNEAVVVQVGNMNIASFSQSGLGNNLGITQGGNVIFP